MMSGCSQVYVSSFLSELENAERVAAVLLRCRPVGNLQDVRNAHLTVDVMRRCPQTSAVGRYGGGEAAAHILPFWCRVLQLQVSRSHLFGVCCLSACISTGA